ncbi:MAG: hypothetical protein ACT4QD_11775 [Acidobacteriota bacterium]
MNLRGWFEYVQEFPTSVAIRESIYGYPALLTAHVVTMCLFAGLVVMMDLRLLGLANRQTPFSEAQRRLFPWQMAGFVLSVITGVLLFYGQPMRYYGKVFYWMKMALVLAAGANAMAFHRGAYRSVGAWDTARTPPAAARLAGALSLAMWALVVVFGRLTAYNWLTFE